MPGKSKLKPHRLPRGARPEYLLGRVGGLYLNYHRLADRVTATGDPLPPHIDLNVHFRNPRRDTMRRVHTFQLQ